MLDGKVIKENFEAHFGAYEGFKGKSYSVYNPRTGQWKQTWVDNDSGYLNFTGELDSDKRIFKRKGMNTQGEEILQRMVFYDITETWQLRWQIFYERTILE